MEQLASEVTKNEKKKKDIVFRSRTSSRLS